MNKDELRDLFNDQLQDLNNFENDIKRIKDLINLIIENFDLLKDDITDEQIGEVSSDINIKASKINSIIQDILSDSKKLESFINEIKLLKRKRDKKLKKDKKTYDESHLNKISELSKLLDKINKEKINKEKLNPDIGITPNKTIKRPNTKPNNWDVQF